MNRSLDQVAAKDVFERKIDQANDMLLAPNSHTVNSHTVNRHLEIEVELLKGSQPNSLSQLHRNLLSRDRLLSEQLRREQLRRDRLGRNLPFSSTSI